MAPKSFRSASFESKPTARRDGRYDATDENDCPSLQNQWAVTFEFQVIREK